MSNELSQDALRSLACIALREIQRRVEDITVSYDDDNSIFDLHGRGYKVSNLRLANRPLTETVNTVEEFFTTSLTDAIFHLVREELPGVTVDPPLEGILQYNYAGRSFTISDTWVHIWTKESIARRIIGYFHCDMPLERL